MLQAVIYYIVTVILTKELVIATDNCTEDQFKTPFSYAAATTLIQIIMTAIILDTNACQADTV